MPRVPPKRGRGRPLRRGRLRTRAEINERTRVAMAEARAALPEDARAEINERARVAMAEARAALPDDVRAEINLQRSQARAALPDDVRAEINEGNRVAMAEAREGLTDAERAEVNFLTRLAMSEFRVELPDAVQAEIRERDRVNTAEVRANLTQEQRVDIRERDRVNTAEVRANMTPEVRAEINSQRSQNRAALSDEQREEINRRNREAMAAVRAGVNHVHIEAKARSYDPANPPEFNLGLRNKPCTKCNALLFDKEVVPAHCCNKGKVELDEAQALHQPYHETLKSLLLGDHQNSSNFFKYIRRYNSAVSFASFGAKTAPPPGNGPYCFRIHGAVHHRSGLLHPDPSEDTPRKFCQIYILEGDGALQARLNNNTETDPNLMFELQNIIETCSPYTNVYKRLHDIEREELNQAALQNRQPHAVGMVFKAGPDRRRYNPPTTDDVAAVYVGDSNGAPGNQDFCVYPKAGDTLQDVPGTLLHCLSTDSISEPIPGINLTELNAINPPGFPIHRLNVKESVVLPNGTKKSCYVRLLKVIDGYPDLIIGTRLKVVKMNDAVGNTNIVCKWNDQEVTIHRENFITEYQGRTFVRCQYPIKLETFLQNINSLNCNLDPLVYPIFFHRGERGYDGEFMQQPGAGRNLKRVSMLDFYAHRLAYREVPFSPLHYGRKLFQQYVVDAWIRTESNRMNYPAMNQDNLRVERYANLQAHAENLRENPDLAQPGTPVVLPSSFTGGPRYMKQQYDDGMAICTEDGKPDIFTTITCNPKHPDIQRNLGNHLITDERHKLTASDRPDIVTAVFKLHLDELKNDLKTMFGAQLDHLHVIEYQKRGLPHAHILIWLKNEAKIRTAEDIDSLICAEIPDPELDPELYEVITTSMMHGPCGTANPNAQCMVNGNCSKKFPKAFQEETQMEVDGYPLYRRRNDGRYVEKNGVTLDNRYVVPYCKYLSRKYKAHINAEVCTSIKAIKYVFKYVFKGHDCANIESTEVDPNSLNEVKRYTSTRYVSAPESMWRLNKFPICSNSRTIVRLDIHLEDQQSVTLRDGAEEADIERILAEGSGSYVTKLTAWFALNNSTTDTSARQYLYGEIPKHYTWQASNGKKWVKRKNNAGAKVITRIYSVSPRDRERFYLRILLFHVRGARSFRDIRTHEGVVYETFEAACRVRGLLIDDTEWHRTLQEASITASARQVRDLFVTILGNCEPSNPVTLWEEFKEDMYEDFVYHHALAPDLAAQYALREINTSLLSNYRLTVTSFGLQLVEGLPALEIPANPHEIVNVETETANFEAMYRQLNDDQRFIADIIINSIETHENRSSTEPRVYFTDAPGGTGKTFVCNTLIAKALSIGLKVASCAWTGIAGNLLRFGQTVHSLTKLPVPILETSTCNIAPNSQQAEFLRSLSMIFIDEASMVPLNALTAIDRMLRDITDCNVPFGGKLLLFAGDFRQTLPVIPRAQPAAVLENCINRSPLWHHFTQLQLTQNMRARAGEDEFCQWLIDLGDGRLRSEHPDTHPDQIDIHPQCNITSNVVESVYPDLNADCSDCIVLAPKNIDTHAINAATLAKFKPNEPCRTYFSLDKYLEDESGGHEGMTVEFLHSQTPCGMPLHKLQLKVGCPIMLLRNLDIKKGLCNGTRLKVLRLGDRCIEAEIVSGSAAQLGRSVFIPRIKLSPSDSSFPFKFQRTQFPVRLCYCMTINKSQGQTFRKVGLYLPEPVFSHGQLYVGCSRARSFGDIYVQVTNTTQQFATENQAITMNVVFNVHDV